MLPFPHQSCFPFFPSFPFFALAFGPFLLRKDFEISHRPLDVSARLQDDAKLVVHVGTAGAKLDGPPQTTANFVLTGQPFEITPEWSEQTVQLAPDPAQWTCLGARHDMVDTYGYGEIADVLRDVNVDIIFVLFPLTIVPVGEVEDVDRQWAAKDYKVDMEHLPKGLVMFDTVQIEYAR